MMEGHVDPDPTSIDDYIRTNRGTYTDDAIRDTLVSAGHDRLAVDAAFRRVGYGPAWNPGPPSAPDGGGLIAEAWILFGVCGLLGLGGFAMASAFSSTGSFPLFLIVYIGLGLGIVLLLRWAVPRLHIRGAWAVVIGFALVPIFGALMFGTCIAAFGIGSG